VVLAYAMKAGVENPRMDCLMTRKVSNLEKRVLGISDIFTGGA